MRAIGALHKSAIGMNVSRVSLFWFLEREYVLILRITHGHEGFQLFILFHERFIVSVLFDNFSQNDIIDSVFKIV